MSGTAAQSAYDQERARRCEWCRRGFELETWVGRSDRFAEGTLVHWDEEPFACTAPTESRFIEELSAELATLREKNWGEYDRLVKAEMELTSERDELATQVEGLRKDRREAGSSFATGNSSVSGL